MADETPPPEIPTPATPAPPETPPETPAAAKVDEKDDEPLGTGGKAALDAERKAKRDAEKRAKDAEARLKTLEDEKLSETEKLKRDAEEGQKLAQSATEKLRRANLLTSLTAQGLSGGKAKAAARLLNGVEYDDDDEPKNLDDALTAAKAEYGEDMFTGATPPAPPPDLHGGARPPAAEADEEAKLAAYMKENFPQTAGSATN